MRLKKSAYALLLGGGLSVLNIGCAAVDALVSSPAGYSAGSSSPQRAAAIGRVFENQGRYAQARSMYRQALRSDPSNSIASDRLEYLASAQPATNRNTAMAEAIAVADTVAPRKRLKTLKLPRPLATDAADRPSDQNESSIQMVRAFDSLGRVESASLTVGGEIEEASADQSVTLTKVGDIELDAAGSDQSSLDSAGLVSFVSKKDEEEHWADSVSEEIAVVSRQEAFESSTLSDFVQVDEGKNRSTEFADTEALSEELRGGNVGFWRPARTRTSLDEVLQWSEAPGQNSEELISAIEQGEDEGVRALSVALLGEITRPDAATITALKQAAITGVPLVKAAALDALVIQGESDSESLDGLLSLLAGDEPKIRTQAAATLLRMANTEWCDDAIDGLHRLLDDTNDQVVAVAATSLSEFGVAAVPCRDRLTEIAATTSSDMVLEATSMALSRIPRSEH